MTHTDTDADLSGAAHAANQHFPGKSDLHETFSGNLTNKGTLAL
jgi:hypothetical protein